MPHATYQQVCNLPNKLDLRAMPMLDWYRRPTNIDPDLLRVRRRFDDSFTYAVFYT
jgi:hypothetical protein